MEAVIEWSSNGKLESEVLSDCIYKINHETLSIHIMITNGIENPEDFYKKISNISHMSINYMSMGKMHNYSKFEISNISYRKDEGTNHQLGYTFNINLKYVQP